MWIYFLAKKFEAFITFKNYKNLVEKETGAFIHYLRTDRGREFMSLDFNNFCRVNGISRQLTAAFTPQQNRVAERINRTITNIVRNMLSKKQIPKKIWPKAGNWAVHVLNRSPTLAVKGMTLEETWSGVKPNVDYFRIFGCIGHVYILDNKRTKLDDKSFECVLLGKSEESKAYRLYDPVSNKVVVSRDVIFEENEGWNWGRGIEEAKIDLLKWEENNIDESGEEAEEEAEQERVEESSEEGEINTQLGSRGRNRREPVLMKDYVTREGLSEEENEHNLVLFTLNLYPNTYEEAVKNPK